MTVLDGFGAPVTRMAVHPSTPRLAVIYDGTLELWDVTDPAVPTLDVTFPGTDLGPGGVWLDVANASGWGFSAVGQTIDGPQVDGHLVLVDVDVNGSALGLSMSTGADWYRLDVSGSMNIITTTGSVSWVYKDGVDLDQWSSDTLVYNHSTVNDVDLHSDTALVTTPAYGGAVLVQPFDDMMSQPYPLHPTGNPQFLLDTPEGWLIPTTGNSVDGCDAAVELLTFSPSNMTLMDDSPCISANGEEDGAFQGSIYNGELFLANGESGLLRLPWTPPNLSVPQTTTLTDAVWPEVTEVPVRVERVDDVLFLLGRDGDGVGVVRICEP